MTTTEEMRKQDIVDQLTWDDSVDANEVHVSVKDGNVKLTGTVPNFTAKLAASKDAYMVAGVKDVENDIDVEYPVTLQVPSDEEITSNINNMLIWNDNILSSNIKVETQNRIVTLRGSVESFWEKSLAGDIAASARGVIDVINTLDIELTKTAMDVDIQQDIKNAYRRSILIDEDKIIVGVNNGIVRLTGSVANYPIKKEALDIAMYTAGVIDVIDELTIE
jgi:osmotically-inducible protein OsmY